MILESFYFTYEELKQNLDGLWAPVVLRFYFTYEELKPYATKPFGHVICGFYLTYEELKPLYNSIGMKAFVNSFYFTYEELKLCWFNSFIIPPL